VHAGSRRGNARALGRLAATACFAPARFFRSVMFVRAAMTGLLREAPNERPHRLLLRQRAEPLFRDGCDPVMGACKRTVQSADRGSNRRSIDGKQSRFEAVGTF